MVLNLNHNRMHVTSCETATVTVHWFVETIEQTRIYVHARPYERVQKLCPSLYHAFVVGQGQAAYAVAGFLAAMGMTAQKDLGITAAAAPPE